METAYIFSKSLNDLLKTSFITGLIEELKTWPGPVLKRHNDAKLLIHKLAFLADSGWNINDENAEEIINTILSHRSPEGIPQILVNIPTAFGGTGKDHFSWMLCDAPLLLYSLIKMGIPEKEYSKPLEYLISINTENGYPCAADSNLGKFNGPGERGTSCPYSNLLMLKLLSLFPEEQYKEHSTLAIESLLSLWENRTSKKPYLFAMGTDFKKLKFPLIWFDILHVTTVLSGFEYANKDLRYIEMLNIIRQKADNNEMYKPESVWRAWKEIDSGQKRKPSTWLTAAVEKILL